MEAYNPRRGDVVINDCTTIIVLCKDVEKIITIVFQKLNYHLRQHHNVEKIIYCDLLSQDLSVTLLSLLTNQEKNTKIIVVKHKKKISIGGAINNCHRITTSNNMVIIDAKQKIELRKISKTIKLLHKAHLVICQDKKKINLAYRKEFIRFQPNNHIRQQIIMIAKKQKLRISTIE